MITPEDLALAQELLREGRVDPATLEHALASLAAGSGRRTLTDALREAGAPVDAPVAGEPVPAADRTMLAGASSDSRPAQSMRKRVGRYEVIEEIARGGMGIVYRALEPGLKRQVALKVLLAGQTAGSEQVERFLREARAAAALSHPNIVQVYEVGEDGGEHFFAMEFIEGGSLDRALKRDGALAPRTALRIARDTARALQHAHERGIVHRDVKPGNIMISGQGAAGSTSVSTGGDLHRQRVLLSDFGLARDASAAAGLTLSGNLLGTPAYMSPEQAGGHTSKIDARSDVFALGAVLYELLSGKQPFHGASLGDVLSAILNDPPVPLAKARPGLHRDIAVIVEKSMEKDPARRYSTAAELADDIDRYLNGEAILAAPPSFVHRVISFARRRTAATVAGAVVLAAICGGTGGMMWRAKKRARDDSDRQAEEGRTRVSRMSARLDAARAFATESRFDDAFLEIDKARAIAPGDPAPETVASELRLARTIHDVKSVLETPSKNGPQWDTATALLKTASEFRDNSEIRRLSRIVEGTCVWSFVSAEPGVDVDVGRAEAGIIWDDESFPPLDEARRAGICSPLGAAPISPSDVAFGIYTAVFSRAGRILRVVPARLDRSSRFEAEYRVLRVGSSAAATHATLTEALAAAAPGAEIRMEGGDYVGTHVLKPGVLICPVAGERVRISDSASATFTGSGVHGACLRDLEIPEAGSTFVSLSLSYATSIIRCRVLLARTMSVEFGVCDDFLIRDCTFEESGIHALALGNGFGGLVTGCTIRKTNWAAVIVSNDGLRLLDSEISEASRIGVFVTGNRIQVRGCHVHDCAEWGVLLDYTPLDSVIEDNLLADCGRFVRGQFPAAIVVNAGSGVRIAHNTVVGHNCGGIMLSGGKGHVILDNLIHGTREYRDIHRAVAGRGLILELGEGVPVVDYNLIASCHVYGGVDSLLCDSVESFRKAANDAFKSDVGLMAHAPSGEPVFADPAGGDWNLAENSPGRRAASDGTDLGARRSKTRATGAALTRRENGRIYLLRARIALGEGKSGEARDLALKAALCLPGDAETAKLLESLR